MKYDVYALCFAKYTYWINGVLILFFSLLICVQCMSLMFSPVRTLSSVTSTRETRLITQFNGIEVILHASLFGVYVANNLSSIKESMANVTLVGILYATKGGNSQVIIRLPHGVEHIYQVGDSIPGGAVIKRIMASGVLLERDARLERLSLSKKELIFEPVAKPLKGD